MKLYTNIIIKTTFEATHCWPECNIEEVKFLQTPHRHRFYVTMKWAVSHSDRDIEFICMQRRVNEFLQVHWDSKNLGSKSCEDMADILLDSFDAIYVSVFEDDENGAEVFKKEISDE